jgi:hypothetical protein
VTIRFEVFAAGGASPDEAWARVGDLRRLPEWTDADAVEVPPGPPSVGSSVVTRDAGRRLEWTVRTLESRLVEMSTSLDSGVLGIGARVVHDRLGSRVILAAALEPASRGAGWGFRLWGAPSLRRRFDRWSTEAVRAQPAGGSGHAG